jgi:hypothetical protein
MRSKSRPEETALATSESLPAGRFSLAQIKDWGGTFIRQEYPFGKCTTYRVYTPKNGLLMLYQMEDGTYSTWDEKANEIRETWQPQGSREKYWFIVNLGPAREKANA